jgi:Zn-dependent metalloprotease
MSVVPPYVLEALERHPSERVRRAAETTRRLSIPRASPPAAPAERVAERHRRYRAVYDCGGTKELPGTLVRGDGAHAAGDPDAERAYDTAGETLGFYGDVLHRDSVDDRGMPVLSSVHYGIRVQNACWNGGQLVYGDGDGEVFRSFTGSVEITGHELTHGMIDADAQLDYEGEAGALSESIADVFGSLVKQRVLLQTADEADWLIGADVFGPGVESAALRSLAAPGSAYDDAVLGGCDPQPSTMRYFESHGSNEYIVHVNSGIPNHAFYRFAKALGGRAWHLPGRVWYEALRSGLPRRCTFRAFAGVTLEYARTHGARAVEALRQAWQDVGISVAAPPVVSHPLPWPGPSCG